VLFSGLRPAGLDGRRATDSGVKRAVIMMLARRGCICHGAVATEDTAMTDRPTEQSSEPTTGWPTSRPTGSAWFTYAQAGERLGMSAEAIRSRARRAGWRTMPGNDGKALVLIPDDATIEPRPAGRPGQRPAEQTEDVARLTEALAAAADRLADQLEHERARADAAVTLAAELREAIAVLEARLAGSEGALAEARAHAERAETSRDTDRARAEALRQMLDEAEAAEERARARVETAEDYVEALRQTEEARRGRGRLARLRAAWRGE
jgi:hypothetical protein